MRAPPASVLLALLPLLAACAAPPGEVVCPPPPALPSAAPATTAAFPVDLPSASAFEGGVFAFALEIDGRGAFSVAGRPVGDDELRALAKVARARVPEVRGLVRADRRASWERVMHALDLLKVEGIAKFAFGIVVAPVPPPVAAASGEPPLAPWPPPPAPRARPKPGGWDCPFPAEADAKGIDNAEVLLVVSVAADGQPVGARVVGEAPPIFGAAALRCALAHAYDAATDAGARVAAETPTIRVRFVR